ncbi:hypothetical protein NLU13_0962 [Sarocladium strictum]|uniref:D-lactate dehydrogenase n=1 Tax=Sarocladium strictum TaxID=5046 RepID=A0AA39GQB4_SARSR|nr:hypothetical protein NLU13_0962 [Sarocladium strictum]
MKLAVFSSKPYDKRYLNAVADAKTPSGSDAIELTHFDFPLTPETLALVPDHADAVCVFVNDHLPASAIATLAREKGLKLILLRCAGFNNVDLAAAAEHGVEVANVPSYSPEAVAEFAAALVQTLNRMTHKAYNRVREGNFALDGLLGRTLHNKTVGVVGTGKIGLAMAKIMKGFGCRILAYDPFENDELKQIGDYTSLGRLLSESDIITLHCPLMDSTRHIINASSLARTKRGALLVNTSRGGLVDTKALIGSLKTGHLRGVALDVYEEEGSLFYDDHSSKIIHDDVLMRLMTFPNAIVTGHQAFFTEEALTEIADTTITSLLQFKKDGKCDYSLIKKAKEGSKAEPVRKP